MWKPPADKVVADTGWKPPADAVDSDQDPSFLQTLSNAADKVTGTMPYVAGLMAPTLGLGFKAAEKMNEASGQLGEATAEGLAEGRRIPNWVPGVGGKRIPPVPGPYAAGLGVIASIASNPQSYVNPESGFAGRIGKPVVPAERAFDVATAQKWGMGPLLTRADQTGSKSAALVETGLSRSITGSGPLQDIARQKLAAIEAAKIKMGSMFGTDEVPSVSGGDAKLGLQDTLGSAYNSSVQLYKDIPDVNIKTPGLENLFNESDFNSIDKGAHPTLHDIRSKIIGAAPPTEETFSQPLGSGKYSSKVNIPASTRQVPGEGNVFEPGRTANMESTLQSQYRVRPVTQDLPVVQPKSETGPPHALFKGNQELYDENGNVTGHYSQYDVFGDKNHPMFKEGKVPWYGTVGKEKLDELGIPVVGKRPNVPEGHVPLDAAPSTVREHGFQKLNDIRNTLSKEIQNDTTFNPLKGMSEPGPKAQSLIPFKQALDKDIQDHIKSSQSTPYGKMESDEFQTSFNKANTYYGAYKSLKNNKFVQKLSRTESSALPNTVFASRKVENINTAKAALGEEGYNAAKQQFFNTLLNHKNINSVIGPGGKYDLHSEFMKGAFNSEELNTLREARSLKNTSLTAEKLAGNPSGTAQVLGSMATGGALVDAARRALTHPLAAAVEATVALGGPYLGTKAYLGTTQGIPASFGRGSMAVTRGAATGEEGLSDERRKSFLSEYLSRVTLGKK